MSRCLRDDTLLWVYTGEGTHAQHAHLATCAGCARRYQRLTRSLREVEEVLQEEPPPFTSSLRFGAVWVRWTSLVAASAAAFLLFWGSTWLWHPSPLRSPVTSPHEEALQFLEQEVSPALFATVDTVVEVPAPVSDLTYIQAALAAEWPCERREPFRIPRCEIYPFPFFTGGQ
jgi:hypothetical protein